MTTKPFPAKYNGRCSKCANPIETGQPIRWTRLADKKSVWHDDCAHPWGVVAPITPIAPISLPETPTKAATDEEIESLKKAIKEAETRLAAEGKDVAHVSCVVDSRTIHRILPLPATSLVTTSPKPSKPISSPTTWYETLEALVNAFKDSSLRVLLIGPPGTGKSRTSIELMDSPYRVTMTEGDGIEDYVGLWNLKDGETVWLDGIISQAMQSGKKVLIDEIDHHPAEIGSALYGWLDDKPHARTPKGLVYAKAGYGVIGTTNSNVTSLPDAILDRFEAVIPACVPHPLAVAGWEENEKSCTWNYFNNLDKSPWTWSGKPTLRRMAAFRRMRPIVGDQCAASCAFGSAGREILSTLSTSAR